MRIQCSWHDSFPVDTAASMLSTSLIGEQYISLQPVAEAKLLANGAAIDIT